MMEFNPIKHRPLLSQINVTPLVDVMLVLLIIFMVTAPMLQEGLDVNLPKVKATGLSLNEEPLVIMINKQGNILINDNRIALADLQGKLENIFKLGKVKRSAMVLLKADESVAYGSVVKVMSEVRKAGVERIGMMTEPVSGG